MGDIVMTLQLVSGANGTGDIVVRLQLAGAALELLQDPAWVLDGLMA